LPRIHITIVTFASVDVINSTVGNWARNSRATNGKSQSLASVMERAILSFCCLEVRELTNNAISHGSIENFLS